MESLRRQNDAILRKQNYETENNLFFFLSTGKNKPIIVRQMMLRCVCNKPNHCLYETIHWKTESRPHNIQYSCVTSLISLTTPKCNQPSDTFAWNLPLVFFVWGSIHTCDILGMNYSLNDRLYCTKWVHCHLLVGQPLCGLKRSMRMHSSRMRITYPLTDLGGFLHGNPLHGTSPLSQNPLLRMAPPRMTPP